MNKEEKLFLFCAIVGILLILIIAGIHLQIIDDEIFELRKNGPCNCTINYGGHNMSVEDALERAGEGLTADQADEVNIVIGVIYGNEIKR